jgi:MFS family permease
MPKNKFFVYGWFMVAIAWICYGFGIAPSYYSWSRFSDAFSIDMGLTRAEFGGMFGVFTLCFSGVGILVGPAIVRWGIRAVMTCGFLTTAIGLFYFSRADTLLDCFIGFSILGGIGIGFATIIPCQTIGQNWFLKKRALAIALILAAGGIVGKGVPYFDSYMLENYTWRTGWVAISVLSAMLGVIAVLLIRESPEKVGRHRDGMTPEEETALYAILKTADGAATQQWTGSQALKTPQFFMVVLCGIAYATPWGIVIPHFIFQMKELGVSGEVAGGLLGTMALISIGGRLAGALGDYFPPQALLAVSLLLEGIGTALLLIADSTPIAYLSISFIGLGFGTAYISVPVVFSHLFGRQAFSVVSGLRLTITAAFSGAGPWVAGIIFDRTGTYSITFLGLLGLCSIGALAAAMLKHPGAPPEVSAAGIDSLPMVDSDQPAITRKGVVKGNRK